MIRKNLILSIISFIFVFTAFSQTWVEDVLKDGYEQRYIAMADDYSGNVRSTVVRKISQSKNSKKALLYVHGYNDYFFQRELGDRFVDSCYNFYAVDLRKYGRSLMAGQSKFEVRNMNEYFADIDSALNIIVKEGNKEIILMGHSTGGLTTSYYLAKGEGSRYPIVGLILNSPFLDMNLSSFMENVMVPIVSWYSYISSDTKINQGSSTAYAESLLRKYHGEWDYNTDWKMEISPDVTSGWIGAIHRAQTFLQDGANIKVPILLMHSVRSVSGGKWSPDHNKGDAVLDVEDISKYGKKLGSNILELKVDDGLHDLILSRKPVREALYQRMFRWLKEKGL
ncbi:MAG: alpha/beta hydrolase [Muribaculaceae bacterium]|nr:alpha/beta hydrolase [Muribaculaceae bacterium]